MQLGEGQAKGGVLGIERGGQMRVGEEGDLGGREAKRGRERMES